MPRKGENNYKRKEVDGKADILSQIAEKLLHMDIVMENP